MMDEDIEQPTNLAEAAPELYAAAYMVCFHIPTELLVGEQEDDDYVDFRVLLGPLRALARAVHAAQGGSTG